eukprot:781368-Amphidinium_carterae.4
MCATRTEIARKQLASVFTLCAAFQVDVVKGDFNQLAYRSDYGLYKKQKNPSAVSGPLSLMCGRLTQSIRTTSPTFPGRTERVEENEDGYYKANCGATIHCHFHFRQLSQGHCPLCAQATGPRDLLEGIYKCDVWPW